ncbi:MAG: hypothetical protein ACRDFS_10475, partial [Chloroflexota bacterium]
VWPWDAEVLIDGQWQLNPELAAAAALQDDPDAVSRILIRPLERPAKSHGSAGERNVHSEH